MTDADAAKLLVMLTTLRLPTISLIWQEFGARVDREGWGRARFLAAICEHELADRRARRVCRRTAGSGLPQSKSFVTFDFAVVPTIRNAHVMALAEGDPWFEQGVNILLFGPRGTGKSHPAGARRHRPARHLSRLREDLPGAAPVHAIARGRAEPNLLARTLLPSLRCTSCSAI